MSRSVTMPFRLPSSTTITAPTRRSSIISAASWAVASGGRQHSACSPSITPGMILRFMRCLRLGLPGQP